ncbi:MAG: DUF4913 domain-containing protein [Acidimicrobiaceae bacterium]|nr:DUF4913 domain-containing protein [Acidimicrobiaceae bacterium]
MTDHSGDTNSDGLMRQLLNQAEAIARLHDQVATLAEETTGSVADLLVRIEAIETAADPRIAGARGVTVWCWRYATENGERELWHELIGWVRWIRQRYPLARRIPDCWAEHPEIVEELTALWLAWQAAYVEADAPLTAAAEWHDRWLPGVLYRLQHGPFALDCDTSHHPRPGGAYAPAQPDIAIAE